MALAEGGVISFAAPSLTEFTDRVTTSRRLVASDIVERVKEGERRRRRRKT